MIASLPMYWRAETAAAWQSFWRYLRQEIDLPPLTVPGQLPQDLKDHWTDPDLALSQTCGLPLRTYLRDRVTYVGTFDFGLGGAPGSYHSVLISRPGLDLAANNLCLAYSSADSQSGWAAREMPAKGLPRLQYDRHVATGSHAGSLAAVAQGVADLAWLDAMTWRLLEAHDPLSKRVEVRGRSHSTPGLPLITAKTRAPEPLQKALAAATLRFDADNPGSFGGPLGFVVLDVEDYLALPLPDRPPLP